MSKDLSKVKAGDFVKSGHDEYGLVILNGKGELIIIFNNSGYGSIKDYYEYRRSENAYNYYFTPNYWEEAFNNATPLFSKNTIEIDIKINGKEAKLSDLSEETLLSIRNNN